ncbi:hypothetical protein C2L64_47060 [Paraburkholderia hospita]|uniref:Uncharacterized protein YtcA n=1 Tax=Paraburkholderia hospita TaxID=169430 RepID=A0AAN1MQJ6_9BURK|nr:hypothetical protein C2L64_47060 [Paraburkholderia hospita]
MFCIAAGVVGTFIVHRVVSKRHQLGVLNPLALSYPMLTILFAVLTWLLFFPRCPPEPRACARLRTGPERDGPPC